MIKKNINTLWFNLQNPVDKIIIIVIIMDDFNSQKYHNI